MAGNQITNTPVLLCVLISVLISDSLSIQVPEMLHNDAGDHGFSHCGFFLLQNVGILLGFCIMLVIALFEHKIQLDLGF